MRSSRIVKVVPYDPDWLAQFTRIRDRIWPSISDLATTIEHVGSTAVRGLAAKPVIDLAERATDDFDGSGRAATARERKGRGCAPPDT
jgi:GrpB-like predicted nucleotidyltransferase (UPF0157 family)